LNAFSALTIALEPASLLVAGFGDPARADDMAGLLVAHRLIESGALSADVWLEGQSPSLPELALRNQVVIVDSVITGAPGGTIHLARYPGTRLTPRSFRKDPAQMKALEEIDGTSFLIGIEIESLRSDALPSETVIEAIEWLSENFEAALKILDVMDDVLVRLTPPTFFPRRYRLY
jgi:Ni,Fe-hydrogenase maturation factor